MISCNIYFKIFVIFSDLLSESPQGFGIDLVQLFPAIFVIPYLCCLYVKKYHIKYHINLTTATPKPYQLPWHLVPLHPTMVLSTTALPLNLIMVLSTTTPKPYHSTTADNKE